MPTYEGDSMYKPYDQFILFGDSITQISASQDLGFGFQPALETGKKRAPCRFKVVECSLEEHCSVVVLIFTKLAYTRRLDVINRGFG
jgi:hypothetical protein